jgi:hypothetical protein
LAASARDTTKSTLSPSAVEESLIRRMVAMGLLDLRCMSRSMATLAPSTTSARRLFWPTGRMALMTLVHPDQVLVVMPTSGTPPPPDPNVTRPIRSRSPRFWTRNFSESRRSVILSPCIEDETGMTTTMSSGTCMPAGTRCSIRPEWVYSVGAVLLVRLAPQDELTEEETRFVLVVR